MARSLHIDGVKLGLAGLLLFVLWNTNIAMAVQSAPASQTDVQLSAMVPQNLLPLLHAAPVHKELKLTAAELEQLESLFAEIDGPWFRSRNLEPEKQRAVIADLEQKAQQWIDQHFSQQQRKRLRQLELQSQNTRLLFRDDQIQQLKISDRQQQRLLEIFQATDQAREQLQQASAKGSASRELQQKAQQATEAEQQALKNVLNRDQQQKLAAQLGPILNMTQLSPTYPLAPEIVPVDHWINSKPLTLKQLRGKVVLIHFYAFQCHNCHANFDIYRRWYDQLREKGVVVIGIQTPETKLERDPQAIEAAAIEKNLKFPIMADLKGENWIAWGNTMWPTVYVVDKKGYIRHWWQGELNWQGAKGDQVIENAVEAALRE